MYDIQTSFKDAVYSVKLKMEFSILNALIKLVKGKLGDGRTTEPDWKSGNSSGRNDTARFSSAFKSSRRQSNVLSAGALRHPAITYSPTDGRLRESEEIQSQRLKSGSVLKTMTTEVSVDKVEKGRDDAGSATSSTVYIIEHNNSGI